ncbi:MAG: ATP-grasp domain-containing protein [Methylobacter sp.]
MKIWVLSHVETSFSISAFKTAAQKLGHEAVLVHPLQCLVAYPSSIKQENNFGLSEAIFHPDLVLTRLGGSAPVAALHLIKQLEHHSIPCINSSVALDLCWNKINTYRRLAECNIPIPQTLLLGSKNSLDEAIQVIPGPPWIVKLPSGNKGRAVLIADSFRSLKSTVDVLHHLGQQLILQTAITEANGRDIRVFVLGGVAIAAMRRCAADNDFRANLHLGGLSEAIPLTTELRQLAEQAAKALQIDVAGVDILESRNGLVVIEVNASPGLEGIQRITGLDLASEVISFAIHKAK